MRYTGSRDVALGGAEIALKNEVLEQVVLHYLVVGIGTSGSIDRCDVW